MIPARFWHKSTFLTGFFLIVIGSIFLSDLDAAASYNIETIAGGGVGDSGAPTTAVVSSPAGVFLDALNNTYIADTNNHRVRMIWNAASTSNYIQGNIYTIAGNGTSGFSGDGDLATFARLNSPRSVFGDNSGNIYVADYGNNRIRRFTLGGNISTIAGGGAGDSGAPTAAVVSSPAGIFLDALNNTYIADTNNHRVRMIWNAASNGTYTQGNIYTIAGNGTAGYSGDGAVATSSQLRNPRGVCLDGSGNIYIADYNNHCIRKFTLGGNISTIAGNGSSGFSGDGGLAIYSLLNSPTSFFVDSASNIYIADQNNNRLRMVWQAASNATYTQNYIYTIAGTGTASYNGDGIAATSAQLSAVAGVCVDNSGNVYIADQNNNRIRRFTLGGNISTIAGGGAGDSGAPTAAVVSSPAGIFLDALNNTYIADTNNHRIRMIWNAASNGTYTLGNIYTIAGNGIAGFSGDTALATSAQLRNPRGVCVDSSGNIYIADYGNHCIRRFTLGGNISTIAGTGGLSGFLGDNALATSARLNGPTSFFVDSAKIYIADQNNNRLRMVWQAASNGIYTQNYIYTIAGNGTSTFAGDGGLATTAQLSVAGVCVDSSSNIFVADQSNSRIRKFALGGNISTVAGGGASLGDGALATLALVSSPQNVFVDSSNNIYIAELGARVRKFTLGGNISTIAGTGTQGYSGDGGLATSAQIRPFNVYVDSSSNVYVADWINNRIRKFAIGGNISTIAGTGASVYIGDGGLATSAGLNAPQRIYLDSSNNVYVADSSNNRIRKFAVGGNISTVAGTGSAGSSGDNGAATSALLNSPIGIFIDSLSNVYVADSNNHRIRKFAVGGNISTIAGFGSTSYIGDGRLATSAGLNGPTNFFVDSLNNVYIADQLNHRIRKFAVGGNISTIAGTGTASYNNDNILATNAFLNQPGGVFVDSSGRVYVADCQNRRIRMFTQGGNISTIAGTGAAGTSGDGGLATSALLNLPQAVFLDASNNIYVADFSANCIRKFTLGGNISTIAGTGVAGTSGDGGLATSAQIRPFNVYVDSSSNVYVAEWTNNNRIRKFTVGGNISTIAGNGATSLLGDGGLAASSGLNSPMGVCVDSAGNAYIADWNNNRVRMFWNAATNATYTRGNIYTIAGTGTATFSGDGGAATSASLTAYGICIDASGNLYIADRTNNRIRKFTVGGTISTIAGGTTAGSTGDNGVAISALLWGPQSVYVNSSNNVYIADTNNNRIRMIAGSTFTVGGSTYTAGNIYTVAGSTAGFSGDSGLATAAQLSGPTGVFVDSLSNLYIADYNNNRVRKFTVGGNITTIAGTASASYNGDNQLATTAQLRQPFAVCTDSANNVYIADRTNHRIRMISGSTGNGRTQDYIYTIAGNGTAGYNRDRQLAISAQINVPLGICVDSLGNIYFADTSNHRIRKLLSNLAFSVAPGGSQTLSGTAATAYVQGGGTAVLPPSNSISAVEVNNGILQVSSSAPITFNASGGAAVISITDNTSTGAYTFSTAGAVQVETGKAAILDTAPAGSGVMSKTGPGRLRALANLSSSTTPVAISAGIFEVSGSTGKLPTAATSVASGAILQLGTEGDVVASGAVPGAADIASGGIIAVAAGVTAPSDAFASATFHSGAILQLGDGATLAQSFTAVA